MIKHVGRHNNRRVIVLFRTVPGEDHMALVAYVDSLPVAMHDSIMKVLESDVGQQAKELADALNRSMLPDGRIALQAMHKEGSIKKVPTNQVIMTPTVNSTVRLDELNKILSDMEVGADAVKKMAELDSQRGLRNENSPPLKKQREVGEPVRTTSADVTGETAASIAGYLDDTSLANSWVAQATKMRNEAKALLAEATRLEKEAAPLLPHVTEKPAKAKAKVSKAIKVKAAGTKTTTVAKKNAKATKKTAN